MPLIFSKIGKLILWLLVSTLFISGTKLETNSVVIIPVGDYILELSGNLDNTLNGTVDFETSITTTSKGISFSTLKLKLNNKSSLMLHSMEFLLSKKTNDALSEGTYKVTGNQDGLLHYFDGVFGFANINALGELPLFAKSGEIQINYLDASTVKGTIRIQMNNALEKSIEVKGNFIATKENI